MCSFFFFYIESNLWKKKCKLNRVSFIAWKKVLMQYGNEKSEVYGEKSNLLVDVNEKQGFK